MLDQGFLTDSAVHRLLVKLSEASDTLPSSLFIKGIKLLENNAEYGGGFADIFRAEYRGERVALKRLRIFESQVKRHETHRVLVVLSMTVWKC